MLHELKTRSEHRFTIYINIYLSMYTIINLTYFQSVQFLLAFLFRYFWSFHNFFPTWNQERTHSMLFSSTFFFFAFNYFPFLFKVSKETSSKFSKCSIFKATKILLYAQLHSVASTSTCKFLSNFNKKNPQIPRIAKLNRKSEVIRTQHSNNNTVETAILRAKRTW